MSANDPTDSDSFHSCESDPDDEELETKSELSNIERRKTLEENVIELSDQDDDEMETKSELSVAERRKLLEEAQNIKEPEPNLSSDEAETKSPSPSAQIGNFGGFFSSIVNGGLDVLETLGKKTFETLTIKDETDDRRRFLLSLSDKSQNLSDILREVRAQNEAAPTSAAVPSHLAYGSANLQKANTNFVILFERADGMVNLEGLELLSNNFKNQLAVTKVDDAFDDQVANFCVEDVSECSTEDFVYEIKKCILGIGLPYKAENVLKMDEDLRQILADKQAFVDAGNEIIVEEMHEAAIVSFAKLTAHSIQALHKIAQLIIIANDLPNVEFVFAFTYVLCRRLSFYAAGYSNLLSLAEPSKTVDDVVTNIYFECSNACLYLKKAVLLLRPFFTA